MTEGELGALIFGGIIGFLCGVFSVFLAFRSVIP